MADIRRLLEATSLQEALKLKNERYDGPQKLVLLAAKATVSAALKTLAKHKILSAPLVAGEPASADDAETSAVDETGQPKQYLGVVDMQDILISLLDTFPSPRSDGYPGVCCDEGVWKELLLSLQDGFLSRQLGAAAGHGDGLPVLHSAISASLLEAAVSGGMSGGVGPAALVADGPEHIAAPAPPAGPAPPRPPPVRRSVEFRRLRMRPRVNHRLAILSADGAIEDVYSQSDLIHFVQSNAGALGPLAHMTLHELALDRATDPGITIVDCSAPTVAAFLKLRTAHVSAIPLVDADGVLVGCLSPSDLRDVLGGNLDELSAPCDVFLRKAQAARDAAAPGGPAPLKAGVRMSSTGLRVISCAPGDTLQTAIDLLCDNGVHRVFVVDTQGAPTGVISLTDVIRTIIARE